MASWVNPSKAVTDLLSHFLQFDPEQLKLGVWSGNLDLSSVNLKEEAFYPLLNPNLPPQDGLSRPPLRLKLVKGTVGHMKFKIPWKRLVWGQGDVRLQVSDVDIVLAYESRLETEARGKKNPKKGDSIDSDNGDQAKTNIPREVKQEWLREAERCHLQGLPIPPKPVHEDLKEEADQDIEEDSGGRAEGRLEKMIKAATSSFLWRFFAGMQATIRNVRIVIVQDGLELGAITHSIEFLPKVEDKGVKKVVEETDEHEMSEGESLALSGDSTIPPPPDFFPRGEYDDAERVEKTLSVGGLGIFVRREGSSVPAHPALRFSSSVTADDFILRPTEFSMAFSLFYPYSTKKRKSTLAEEKEGDEGNDPNADSSTSAGSKRRSKREKASGTVDETTTAETTSPGASEAVAPAAAVRPKKHYRSSSTQSYASVRSGTRSRPRTQTETDLPNSASPLWPHHRRKSTRMSGIVPLVSLDEISVAITTDEPIAGPPPPHIDFQLTLGDLKMVCSTRHYSLAHEFAASVARTRNGRPKKTIASYLDDEDGRMMRKTLVVEAPVSTVQRFQHRYEPSPTRLPYLPDAPIPIPRPISSLTRFSTVGGNIQSTEWNDDSPRVPLQLRLQLQREERSERSEVVLQWWRYAISAVTFEIRVRRQKMALFGGGLSFSWVNQKNRRREYVDLYIATHLEASSTFINKIAGRMNDTILREIEDELPVEQILLYRAIARALRVRGMKKMPNSLLELHGEKHIAVSPRRKRDESSRHADASPRKSAMKGTEKGDLVSDIRLRVREGRRRTEPRADSDSESNDGEADMSEAKESVSPKAASHNVPVSDAELSPSKPSAHAHSPKGAKASSGKRTSFHIPDGATNEIVKTAATATVDGAGAKSVYTFNTAKSAASRASRKSSVSSKTGDGPVRGALRYSVAISIESLDVLVYRNEAEPVEWEQSTKSVASGGRRVGGFRAGYAAELNIVADGSESNLSDISILSDDEMFFNDGDEAVTVPDEERMDRPILSSTDFLLFGAPTDIVLQLTVSPVSCKIGGRSGMPLSLSTVVGQLSLNGYGDCHLLSLGSDEIQKGVDEALLESGTKHQRRKSVMSSISTRSRAVSLTLSKFGGNTDLVCDLWDLKGNIDIVALNAIWRFFDDTETFYPTSIIDPSPRDYLRKIVLGLSKSRDSGLGHVWNTALRLHGAEFRVDTRRVRTSSVAGSVDLVGDAEERQVSSDLIFRLETFEFFNNLLADHILSISYSAGEAASRAADMRPDVPEPLMEMHEWTGLNVLNEETFANLSFLGTMRSIYAARGVSCGISDSDGEVLSEPMKIFESPIDIEAFVVRQRSYSLSSNAPQQQLFLEVSPVNILLSDSRCASVRRFLNSLGQERADVTVDIRHDTPHQPLSLLPRLEALSDLIVFTLTVSISQIHLSIVEDSEIETEWAAAVKQVVMEECLMDYLNVLSSFGVYNAVDDVVFETVMHICIDRLKRIGLNEREALDCVERARRGYFAYAVRSSSSANHDDNLGARVSKVSTEKAEEGNVDVEASLSDFSAGDTFETASDADTPSLEERQAALSKIVHACVTAFSDFFFDSDGSIPKFDDRLTLELPEGMNFTVVQAFYDMHLESSISDMNIKNGAGVQLLRIQGKPLDSSVTGGEQKSGSATEVSGEAAHSQEVGQALFFCVTELDKYADFASGGEPLSTLASDADKGEIRERQRIFDGRVGEYQILFSQKIYVDAFDTITRLLCPSSPEEPSSGHGSFQDGQALASDGMQDAAPLFYATIGRGSLVLLSDELRPFTQLLLESHSVQASSHSGFGTRLSLESDCFALINLTPEGRFYPGVLSPLGPGEARISVEYTSSANQWKVGSELRVIVKGVRVVILQKYLNEFLQYLSEDYGFGLFLRNINGESAPLTDLYGNPMPPLHYHISFFDSSLIVPRSSTDVDLLAVEASQVTISNGYCQKTFEVPTRTSSLAVSQASHARADSDAAPERSPSSRSSEAEFFDCIETPTASPVSSFDKSLIKQLKVQFETAHLFTSLDPKSGSRQSEGTSLPFSDYEINGRAQNGKLVYLNSALEPEDVESSSQVLTDSSLSLRRWEQISQETLSTSVLVEYAPHRRILVTGEINNEGNVCKPCLVDLDLQMSQYCLLLSVYYSNMQELPAMFPYSPSQLSAGAQVQSVPTDFPEYGTEEYVCWLKRMPQLKSELACLFGGLSIRCSFDPPGYFEAPNSPASEGAAIRLVTRDVIIHSTTDVHGILRLGSAASFFSVVDERHIEKLPKTFSVSRNTPGKHDPHADLSWGLDCNVDTLNQNLAQPFQSTVFMTPGWSLINVGFDQPDVVMKDMSVIFLLTEYFGSFFGSAIYGHPAFEAAEYVASLKEDLSSQTTMGESPPRTKSEDDGSNKMDIRLWMLRPVLTIPSNTMSDLSPCVHLTSRSGFWYRYRKIGEFVSNEMCSTDLSLTCANEFHDFVRSATDNESSRTLVDGLSFGLRLDSNSQSPHSDVFLRIPLLDGHAYTPDSFCGIHSPEIAVRPVKVQPAVVCTPARKLSRTFLGASVCEVTLLVELFPLVSSLLIDFVQSDSQAPLSPSEDRSIFDDTTPTARSFSVLARVGGLRLFAIDPLLGMHLPISVIYISSVELTASQLGSVNQYFSIPRGEAPPEDQQIIVDALVWADYFKLGSTRSWEPLLEPVNCLVLYEKSRRRGQGVTFSSDNDLHLNITGALILTLDEVVASFSRTISEAFGERPRSLTKEMPRQSSVTSGVQKVEEQCCDALGQDVYVTHQLPRPTKDEERVPFTFQNCTGQTVRLHKSVGSTDGSVELRAIITYLDHLQSTPLTFDATISVTRNLEVVEVPYPGLPNPKRGASKTAMRKHCIDLQIPGFKWLQNLSVDTSGRRFEDLIPRDPVIKDKVAKDWRLANAMKILAEIGLQNGGRLISVRSLFEVRNRTSHQIELAFHPDPRHKPLTVNPDSENIDTFETAYVSFQRLGTDFAFQIPMLLLETSLRLDGNHLGSFWIRPQKSDDNVDLADALEQRKATEGCDDAAVVNFCSRPIQLSKIVHESAVIFERNNYEDVASDKAKSGIQVSCPLSDNEGEAALAPFCYVVEIRRSPIVTQSKQEDPLLVVDHDLSTKGRVQFSPRIHRPVSYSLFVHPPLIIENLLSKRGRFELMHAGRRTVMWFADLDPGQRIPVHTVGLDAPLLLLVNLGFCRTPVGEGALVHHGSDISALKATTTSSQVGLKTIGKAVTKGTKQIGKTITQITESPDRRAMDRLADVKGNHPYNSGKKWIRKRAESNTKYGSLGLDSGDAGPGGKVHAMEYQAFSPEDCVSEMTIVDSIGQKLTLKIENIRGGGGQRHISLFCPFWIVNTTEHALRYKQDKSSAYVSGTVVSPEMDGSGPVDGSDRNYVARARRPITNRRALKATRKKQRSSALPSWKKEAVFAGTAGALATSPGKCMLSPAELASWIDQDLPMEKLVSTAFMFNFHEEALSIGEQRLCVQLGDGTGHSPYGSDWSKGFSIDSVGVNQVVGMHCKDGRALEVSVTCSVAPGFLSAYTKIVRFSPRFVLVNKLRQPIRLWQDSSLLHPSYEFVIPEGTIEKRVPPRWQFKNTVQNQSTQVSLDPLLLVNQYENLFGRPATIDESQMSDMPSATTAHRLALYIASVRRSEFCPFHLPDSRGDPQLRIDLGGSWNLTASFGADAIGENTFHVTRALDLRLLDHVTTRASPQYTITLPPPGEDGQWDGELGVWFETDWGGERRIIVKGTKKGEYAFNHTDIHVGDELLRIDDVPVSQLTFQEAMKLLRDKLAYISLTRSHRAGRRARGSIMNRLQRRSTVSGPPDLQTLLEALGGDAIGRTVLTFRTHEERLRRVRARAAVSARRSGSDMPHLDSHRNLAELASGDRLLTSSETATDIKVDMRFLHNSIIVEVQQQDTENPPFRIENRAVNHVIFYRQRGCNGHAWNSLTPGESRNYCWEEPLRPRKLTVRVGLVGIFFDASGQAHLSTEFGKKGQLVEGDPSLSLRSETEKKGARIVRASKLLSMQNVENEEQGGLGQSRSVKLEEIGFTDFLPLPTSKKQVLENPADEYLSCKVDADGATRVLIVSDSSGEDEGSVLQSHLLALKSRIDEERHRVDQLLSLKAWVRRRFGTQPDSRSGRSEGESKMEVINEQDSEALDSDADEPVELGEIEGPPDVLAAEERARHLVDLPEESSIVRCHQLIVEVLEATGLRPTDVSGLCNPYCDISLVGPTGSRRSAFFGNTDKRKTYFVEKTITPKWANQSFVFDVPPEAVRVTRGHRLQVKLRSFRLLGQHPHLGQTTVHLRSLRNQQALEGWYPLVGRTGRRDLGGASFDNSSRGSLKLRVQWIYTVPALVDYFLMLSEKMLSDLQQSREGMRRQHEHFIETERKRKEHVDLVSSVRIPNILKKLKNSHEKQLWGMYFEPVQRRHRTRRGRLSVIEPKAIEQVASQGKRATKSLLKDNLKSVNEILTDQPPSTHFIRQRQRADTDTERRILSRRHFRALSMDFSSSNLPETPMYPDFSPRMLDYNESENHGSVVFLKQNSLPGDIEEHRAKVISHLSKRGVLYSQRYLVEDRQVSPLKNAISSESDAEVSSWTAAQAFVNDRELKVDFADSRFRVSLDNSEVAVPAGALNSRHKLALSVPILLPSSAPDQMASRALSQANDLAKSRKDFERACTRSLGAVLNPGGWLTIRPVTALNLPDAFTRMHVKLRYGSEVAITESVEAKVTPIWSSSDKASVNKQAVSVQETTLSPGNPSETPHDRFVLLENDLQVYVEPQKTSGSLRLSVIGERMNSRVELGVLYIPLGAAISCCVDAIEESLDRSTGNYSASQSGTPMYVRWFPLMNPKDSVRAEGDMGLSSRPPDTEKEHDSMFHQYFMPCIKLALIWHPAASDISMMDQSPGLVNPGSGISSVYSQLLSSGLNNGGEKSSSLINHYFNGDLGTFSASLVSSQRAKELMTLNLSDVDVRYSMTKSKTRLGLVIGWMQLDHHHARATEPVVLAPTTVEHPQPTLNFLAVKDNLRSKANIDSYEFIGASLQEMDLSLEQTWMRDLWDFVVAIVRRSEVKKKTLERGLDYFTSGEVRKKVHPRGNLLEEGNIPEPSLFSTLMDETPEDPMSRKVYVEQLVLGFVKVNVSYFKGKKDSYPGSTEKKLATGNKLEGAMENVALAAGGLVIGGRTSQSREGRNVFDTWSENTHEEDLWREGQETKNLPSAMAAVFPSVSDAPIRINGKAIEHVFESPAEILGSIRNYYMNEALKQIYKIIGSLDVVGNPTMLINSVASGVRDFFYLPSKAFLRTPMDPSRVGIGMAKGTLSLLSHSSSGFFAFVAKVSASVGQASAFLSLDPDYKRWHRETILAEAKNLNREWKRRGVERVGTILGRPLYDITRGFTLGITGVVVSPFKYARRGGPLGLGKGIAIGVVGLVVKPLTGIFDSVAHLSGSLHHVARSANVLEKRLQPAKKLRLAHTFGLKSVLLPFDPVASRSTQFLRRHPTKTKRSRARTGGSDSPELHIASEVLNVEAGVDTYAIVTTRRIVLFRVRKDKNGSLMASRVWEVDLTNGAVVSSRLQDQGHNGVGLVIASRMTKEKLRSIQTTPSLKSSASKRDGLSISRTPTIENLGTPPSKSISQFYSALSRASLLTLGEGNEIEPELQPMVTQAWEESLAKKSLDESDETEMAEESEPALHGSTQGKQGDEIEWFLVLAEFQQRRQLLRIHNAICCLVGDFGSVIDERRYGYDQGTEGYTSFGQFEFGEFETVSTHYIDTRQNAINDVLDKAPWIHGTIINRFAEHKSAEEQMTVLSELRKEWVLSRELEESNVDGGPAWLVDARARAMFVPMDPPELPNRLSRNDEVVSAILDELEMGNISWNQANELIEQHAQSQLEVIDEEEASGTSIATQEGSTDDLDHMSAKEMDDLYRTARFEQSSAALDRRPTLTRSASLSMVNDQTRRLELDLKEEPLEDNAASETGDSFGRGSVHSMPHFPTRQGAAPLMRDERPVPEVDVSPSPRRQDLRPLRFAHAATEKLLARGDRRPSAGRLHEPTTSADLRLHRLEIMMEELLEMNRRRPRYLAASTDDDPTIVALRAEIEDLRAVVQSTVAKNDREQIIATLREEVKTLKAQLQQKIEEEQEEEEEEGEGDDDNDEDGSSDKEADDRSNEEFLSEDISSSETVEPANEGIRPLDSIVEEDDEEETWFDA